MKILTTVFMLLLSFEAFSVVTKTCRKVLAGDAKAEFESFEAKLEAEGKALHTKCQGLMKRVSLCLDSTFRLVLEDCMETGLEAQLTCYADLTHDTNSAELLRAKEKELLELHKDNEESLAYVCESNPYHARRLR